MNKNPLLVKSSLVGKIPFMKGKTASLYGRYLSNHRLNKVINSSLSETVSAFTVGSTYPLKDNQIEKGVEPSNFVFDETSISQSKFFTEREWIALGMLLRAYKEVEEVNLLHLYNCLYSGEKNIVKGHVVSGRTYTLYSSTQLPVKVKIYDPVNPSLAITGTLRSLSKNSPTLISPDWSKYSEVEKLLNIELEFTGNTYQPCTLVEGNYRGLSHKSLLGAETNLTTEFFWSYSAGQFKIKYKKGSKLPNGNLREEDVLYTKDDLFGYCFQNFINLEGNSEISYIGARDEVIEKGQRYTETGCNFIDEANVDKVVDLLKAGKVVELYTPFYNSTSKVLVAENLGLGEYSDKLVEFFAGTLVTPLSDPKLISNVGFKLPGSGATIWEKTIENTKGFYNQDGYLDKRNRV